MKVWVDVEACIGSGTCAMTAPAVFQQSDDDGFVVLLDPSPPPSLHSSVRHASTLCPARAIAVDD
jgi:ferredoxin